MTSMRAALRSTGRGLLGVVERACTARAESSGDSEHESAHSSCGHARGSGHRTHALARLAILTWRRLGEPSARYSRPTQGGCPGGRPSPGAGTPSESLRVWQRTSRRGGGNSQLADRKPVDSCSLLTCRHQALKCFVCRTRVEVRSEEPKATGSVGILIELEPEDAACAQVHQRR